MHRRRRPCRGRGSRFAVDVGRSHQRQREAANAAVDGHIAGAEVPEGRGAGRGAEGRGVGVAGAGQRATSVPVGTPPPIQFPPLAQSVLTLPNHEYVAAETGEAASEKIARARKQADGTRSVPATLEADGTRSVPATLEADGHGVCLLTSIAVVAPINLALDMAVCLIANAFRNSPYSVLSTQFAAVNSRRPMFRLPLQSPFAERKPAILRAARRRRERTQTAKLFRPHSLCSIPSVAVSRDKLWEIVPHSPRRT